MTKPPVAGGLEGDDRQDVTSESTPAAHNDTDNSTDGLLRQHAQLIRDSRLSKGIVLARGYRSVTDAAELEKLGITRAARNVPGLLIPLLRKDGSVWGYLYRPDMPRLGGRKKQKKPIKYEAPTGQRNGIDVPPGVGPTLNDPKVPLWITEGSRKADSAVFNAGLACVSITGVWNWRGTNADGGKTTLADWEDIALNGREVVLAFDSDVVRKPSVHQALLRLANYLESKGAKIRYCHLPPDEDGAKVGLDDYLAAGHSPRELHALVRPEIPDLNGEAAHHPPVVYTVPPSTMGVLDPITLDECHEVFHRWFGDKYDLDVTDVALIAAAVEKLDGDPLWLLVVSGPGNAKTETVQTLASVGAHVVSTISSEAALLSATPEKERASDATGGLLRKIGTRGILVIKDVTSILSADRNLRGQILAALREIYDGRWSREVGAEGGRSLLWEGRIVVIGAVTTAWDAAHEVVATMGDRFVNIRPASSEKEGRTSSRKHAISNTGSEETMRSELSDAMAGVLAGLDSSRDLTLTEDEAEEVGAAADLVSLARTAVIADYRGDVVDAHAPEAPTRLAKQLAQIIRGGVALGMDREKVRRLAIRCARDSMPPLRLAVIDDVAEHPHSTPTEIRRRLDKPRTTVDRQCQALHMLGVLTVDEASHGGPLNEKRRWYYSLADGIDPNALKTSPGLLPPTPDPVEESATTTTEEMTSEMTLETPLRRGNTTGDDPPQVSDSDDDQWWVDSPTARTDRNPPQVSPDPLNSDASNDLSDAEDLTQVSHVSRVSDVEDDDPALCPDCGGSGAPCSTCEAVETDIAGPLLLPSPVPAPEPPAIDPSTARCRLTVGMYACSETGACQMPDRCWLTTHQPKKKRS